MADLRSGSRRRFPRSHPAAGDETVGFPSPRSRTAPSEGQRTDSFGPKLFGLESTCGRPHADWPLDLRLSVILRFTRADARHFYHTIDSGTCNGHADARYYSIPSTPSQSWQGVGEGTTSQPVTPAPSPLHRRSPRDVRAKRAKPSPRDVARLLAERWRRGRDLCSFARRGRRRGAAMQWRDARACCHATSRQENHRTQVKQVYSFWHLNVIRRVCWWEDELGDFSIRSYRSFKRRTICD